MRRRNLILITVLSLSLTFAAGCGENKNTGAAGSMDQQKTSETTVQNETEPETSQVSEDSEQPLPQQRQGRTHSLIIR